ncbi:MAG: CoA-transferase subunit beta [Acidimicrobiales bacterium]
MNADQTTDWSSSELMATVLASQLHDGEVAIMGTASAIPQASCRLAQLTHAPNFSYIAGGTCSVNPYQQPLVASACDYHLLRAETAVPLTDVVLMEGRGDVFDIFFAGGIQIDVYGNCNLVAVGSWDHPHPRGPGSVGLPFLSRVGRTLIYTTSHNRRTFVEKVDFLSGPGFLDGPMSWQEAKLTGGGPAIVVTPLCTMTFNPETLRMRLATLHPGVELPQVVEATGFELEIEEPVSFTPPPSSEQLDILRAMDPNGLLR